MGSFFCLGSIEKDSGKEAVSLVCNDTMVEHFALVGPVDEVRARVDRIAQVANSFTLCVPFYGLALEQIGEYNKQIAAAFYD